VRVLKTLQTCLTTLMGDTPPVKAVASKQASGRLAGDRDEVGATAPKRGLSGDLHTVAHNRNQNTFFTLVGERQSGCQDCVCAHLRLSRKLRRRSHNVASSSPIEPGGVRQHEIEQRQPSRGRTTRRGEWMDMAFSLVKKVSALSMRTRVANRARKGSWARKRLCWLHLLGLQNEHPL
jgi:hypothetical protein